MSTSNVKPPLIIRSGFTADWVNSGNQRIELENIIRRELGKFSMALVNTLKVEGNIVVVFYRYIQAPFETKRNKRIRQKVLANATFISRMSKLHFPRYINMVSRSLKADSQGQVQTIHSKWFVENLYYESYHFVAPHVLLDFFRNNLDKNCTLINVYSAKNVINWSPINLLDFIRHTSDLRYMSSRLKYVFDAVVLYDLISAGSIAGAPLIAELIQYAIIRNSKRGMPQQFLQMLSKLFRQIKLFDVRCGVSTLRSWQWTIKVTGKFQRTGRTSVIRIQPKSLALHTVSDIFDYAERVANVKIGSFSIKVTHYQIAL